MATIGGAGDPVESVGIDGAIARMAAEAMRTSPIDVLDLLDFMCQPLGARAARFYVADYSLRTLQQIGTAGPVGARLPIAGTMIGRVFTSGEIQVARTDPTVVSVPLVEGSCPIGVLELDVDVWDDRARDLLQSLAGIFVMAWIVKTRYTDQSARARRSERLAPAAEVQWDLLPPLSCSAEQVALSGLLEPAYDLGGDSFDYAFDKTQVDFAILDAVGHGLPAVLMSAAAINSLRNTRRARGTLSAAYHSADRSIAAQFGESSYVTGVIGSLDLEHGTFVWVNAGHVLPMLVRNGKYAGPLNCKPSLPLGLGGAIVEIGKMALQRGDRLLLYTDGITEARSADGSFFGDDRLADLLVRASLENLPAQETVRHLGESVLKFSKPGLRDDATMLLIHYHPPAQQP